MTCKLYDTLRTFSVFLYNSFTLRCIVYDWWTLFTSEQSAILYPIYAHSEF